MTLLLLIVYYENGRIQLHTILIVILSTFEIYLIDIALSRVNRVIEKSGNSILLGAKKQILVGIIFIVLILIIDRLVNLVTGYFDLEYSWSWTLIPIANIIPYIYRAIDKIAWNHEKEKIK